MRKGIFTIVSAVLLAVCMLSAGNAATGKVVREAEIKRQITEYVKERTSGLGLEVTVKKIGYRGDLQLSSGAVSYEVVAPGNWEGWGRANLALIVRVDDRIEKNIPVAIEVEALADLVVTVRPLERGEVITGSDVALQKRDLASVSGRISRSLDEVIGKRLKNSVRGSTPLRPDYLERVPVVKTGQLVTIIAENQTLRLTAPGKARGNGAEGDRVMVQNLNSLKELPAKVIDASTVQVDF